jgi:hypothetical protein
MFTRKSGILALALSALVLGACDDDETIAPTPDATISIAPSPVPAIDVGSTFQLVAITANAPAGSTVAWVSLNPAVATVNGTSGLVTCVSQGTTTITATISGTSPAVQNAVAISCQDDDGGVVGTPTISISRITNAAGADVNPGNVAGVVNVITNVDIPAGVAASAMRVTVNGTEVCRTSFAGGAGADAVEAVPVTVVCSFNTAQLDANGNPLFPNGQYQIQAEVLGPTGTAIATSTSQQLTFNNVSSIGVSVAASGATAPDQAGLIWNTGDLTVTVTPSIFTGPSNAVASGTVTVRDANTGAVIAQAPLGTANAAGQFVVVFPEAVNTTNGNLDVSEAESPITVQVSTITAGGNQGVGFGPAQPGANPFRLDNDAPDTEAPDPAASFASPGWFSTATDLSDPSAFVNDFGTLDDEGVNREDEFTRLQFNTNPAATNSSSGWTDFTDVSALPETVTTTELAFRAVVCDALGNCTNVGPVQAGVDRSVPSARIDNPTSADPNQVNPGQELFVIGTDAISGVSIVSATIEGRSVFEIDANPDTDLRCYDNAGAVIATNPTSGTCAAQDVPTASGPGATENSATIVIPADENWYTFTIVTVDVAGNTSTTVLTQNNLVDVTVPSATIGSTTITGTTSTISGTVEDNIQVRQYDSRFQFVGLSTPDEIPFSQPTAVDATLDNTLTGQAAASATSSLVVRALREGLAGGDIQPTAYGFGVFDMANWFGFNGAAIAFGASPNPGLQNTALLTFTDTPDPICKTGTSAACPAPNSTARTSSALSLVVETAVPGTPTTPFANPVARVYWYFTHPGADNTLGNADDYLVLIGQTDAAAATVQTNATTGVRTFTFNSSVAAATFPMAANFPIHAIAVDAEGDAVMTHGTLNVQ